MDDYNIDTTRFHTSREYQDRENQFSLTTSPSLNNVPVQKHEETIKYTTLNPSPIIRKADKRSDSTPISVIYTDRSYTSREPRARDDQIPLTTHPTLNNSLEQKHEETIKYTTLDPSPIIRKTDNHSNAEYLNTEIKQTNDLTTLKQTREKPNQNTSFKKDLTQVDNILPDLDIIRDITYYETSPLNTPLNKPLNKPLDTPLNTPLDTPLDAPLTLSEVTAPMPQQPQLGDTLAKEAALFLEMIKPYQDLDDKQKQVAVHTIMTLRVEKYSGYGDDLDSEGVIEFFSSPWHSLEDEYQNIDCDDYITLFRWYLSLAKLAGYLPKEVQLINMLLPGHLVLGYITPVDEHFEYYAIDNSISNFAFVYWSREEFYRLKGLTTMKEYETMAFSLEDVKQEVLASPVKEGSLSSRLFDIKAHQYRQSNSTVADSISVEEVFKKHQDYIKTHGEISLPKDFNEQEYSARARAAEILDLISDDYEDSHYYTKFTSEDLNITALQAKYLIGQHSSHLGKALTAEDLALKPDVKNQLVGMYSPVLKRSFNERDLFIQTNKLAKPVVDDQTIVKPYVNHQPIANSDDNDELIESFSTTETSFLDGTYIQQLWQKDVDDLMIFSTIGLATGLLSTNVLAKNKLNKVTKRRNFLNLPRTSIKKLKNKLKSSEIRHRQITPNDFHTLKLIFSLDYQGDMLADGKESRKPMSSDAEIIKQILLSDKMPIDILGLKQLINNILTIYQTSGIENSELLPKNTLVTLLSQLDDFDLRNKENINHINDIMDYFGVHISFESPKFLGTTFLRHSAEAINPIIKIHTDKLYTFLSKINKVMSNNELKNIIDNNIESFNILNKLKHYDKNKLQMHKSAFRYRLGAAAGTVIPAAPISDLVKAKMVQNRLDYIKNNKKIMKSRVDSTIKIIEESSLSVREKTFLTAKTTSLLETKKRHLKIKKYRLEATKGLYAASTVASVGLWIAPAIAYPIKSATKASIRASIEISFGIKRYISDKKSREANEYATTKEVFLLFKDWYLDAQKNHNTEKTQVLSSLVESLFEIPEHVFKVMIYTQMVETGRFKPNLYQPIDNQVIAS